MARKRTIICIVILLLVGAGLFGIGRLLIMGKVAEKIVNDEAAWDLRDASPRMKVIITEGGMVARYLDEDEDNYIGDIQDTVFIPKSRAMVETWYASDGRGVVFLKEFGQAPAYAEPDGSSDVVATLTYEEGYVPDTYPCLGLDLYGWYRIDVAGTSAYIESRYVSWDAIDTF